MKRNKYIREQSHPATEKPSALRRNRCDAADLIRSTNAFVLTAFATNGGTRCLERLHEENAVVAAAAGTIALLFGWSPTVSADACASQKPLFARRALR